MINRGIVSRLNDRLSAQKANFFVGLVGEGMAYCWLKTSESKNDKPLFQIKVESHLVEQLIDCFEEWDDTSIREDGFSITTDMDYEDHIDESIIGLFKSDLLDAIGQEQNYFPYCGIVVGSYAEFFVHCGDFEDVIDYTVGDQQIRVSKVSFLLRNLFTDFSDDYLLDIDNHVTIKIVGTSSSSIEQDLASILFYLRNIAPTADDFGGWPGISELAREAKDLPKYSRTPTTNRTFPEPQSRKAVVFFYAAENADDVYQNDIAVLNYYRSIEHFFGNAWHHKIKQILVESNGNVELIASKLRESTPSRDIDSLILVIEQIIDDEVWEYVRDINFCESTISALAKKVYSARNKVAHGQDEIERDNIAHPPSILPTEELVEQREVLALLAEKALLFYNRISIKD